MLFSCLPTPMRSCLFFACFMITQAGFAQQVMMTPPDQELNFNSKAILPAPAEAASINKGGDVSVNLSVGAPTVMIPIANVTSRFISFPVSLNYSSNGIRVNELASNTGLGWSLNCGGAVTRSTLGLPDEERSQFNNDFTNFTKTELLPIDRATMNYLTYTRDRESDIFDFSVNGYINGKFILDQNFQPKLLNAANYKITLLTTNIKDGFKIVDDKGMIFLFTVKDTSYYDRGTCASDPGERIKPVYNAWHLSQIIKPNQDTVYFNYESNVYEYISDINQNESICISSTVGGCGPESPTSACPLFVSTFTTCKTIQTVKGSALKEIVFVNGKLAFEYVANRVDMHGGKALKSISLINTQDTIKYCRLITDFGQRSNASYDPDTTLKYRLFLRSIQVGSSKSKENEHRYEFGYLNETLLPARHSAAQDMRGLANGQNNFFFLTNIEAEYPGLNYYGMGYPARFGNRSVNPETMTAGLLNRVTYPTGGKDSILYAPNRQRVEKLHRNFVTDNNEICPDLGTSGKADTMFFTISTPQYVKWMLDIEPNHGTPGVHHKGFTRLGKVGSSQFIFSKFVTYDMGFVFDSVFLDQPGNYYLIDSMALDRMCFQRQFDYEAPPDTTYPEEPIGGVSVAGIISKDPNTGTELVKKYSYRYRENGELSTFPIIANESYVYTNTVKRFINCENYTDCSGVSYCTYLVHGSSQITPESLIGGNYFYHNSVTEIVTGADSIDRSTEHLFQYNQAIVGRAELGAYIPGTPYGIIPEFLLGETKTSNYSHNRLTGEEKTFNTTLRHFNITEHQIVENFNVVQIYQSPCSGTPVTAVEIGAFNVNVYPIYYQRVELVSETDSVYSSHGNESLVNATTNTYTGEPYCLLRKTVSRNSKNEDLSNEMTYIFDEPSNPMNALLLAQNKIAITAIANFNQTQLKNKRFVYYKQAEGNNNILSDYKVDEIIGAGPVSTVSEKTILDAMGHVVEAKVKEQYSAYIWGCNQTQVTAAANNATAGNIAYTSFEDQTDNSWVIPSPARNSTAITGKYSFDLGNAGSTGLVKTGLSGTQKYILAYWTMNATPYAITGTTGTIRKGLTANGWTYFEHTVSDISSLTVSGTGLIDELRLYPATAEMTTYTHIPLVGISSQCDTKGNILFYEYDTMGRLSIVRDINKNILKQIDYKYQSVNN